MDFIIAYYLGDMFHTVIVHAENMACAIEKHMKSIPDTSKPILHDFKIERYFVEW